MRSPWASIHPARARSAAALTAGQGTLTPGRNRDISGELDDIRARLEAIGEELADLALVRLRESIDAGGTELPVDERRLTRARRAVEKAAAILAEPDDTL
jgi:hypothetical protein